jgi:peptidoglycan L-alanyl-D-glutamate endopeptidase CwlK
MPTFSTKSLKELESCHDNLQLLFREVVKHFDCTVLEGHRGKEAQDEAVRKGTSHVRWPNGKHNSEPSMAVDVAPYPIDWKDRERFYYFAGFVKGVAARMGIAVRWGGDWDSDTQVKDQTFHDLPHFELVL